MATDQNPVPSVRNLIRRFDIPVPASPTTPIKIPQNEHPKDVAHPIFINLQEPQRVHREFSPTITRETDQPLKEKIQKHQMEILELKELIERQNIEISSKKDFIPSSELTLLQNQNSAQEKQISDLQLQNSQHEKEIADLQTTIQQLEKDHFVFEHEIQQKLRIKDADFKKQMENVMSDVQSKLLEKEAEIQQITETKDAEMKTKLDAKQAEYQQKLEILKGEVRSKMIEKEHQIQQLSDSIEIQVKKRLEARELELKQAFEVREAELRQQIEAKERETNRVVDQQTEEKKEAELRLQLEERDKSYALREAQWKHQIEEMKQSFDAKEIQIKANFDTKEAQLGQKLEETEKEAQIKIQKIQAMNEDLQSRIQQLEQLIQKSSEVVKHPESPPSPSKNKTRLFASSEDRKKARRESAKRDTSSDAISELNALKEEIVKQNKSQEFRRKSADDSSGQESALQKKIEKLEADFKAMEVDLQEVKFERDRLLANQIIKSKQKMEIMGTLMKEDSVPERRARVTLQSRNSEKSIERPRATLRRTASQYSIPQLNKQNNEGRMESNSEEETTIKRMKRTRSSSCSSTTHVIRNREFASQKELLIEKIKQLTTSTSPLPSPRGVPPQSPPLSPLVAPRAPWDTPVHTHKPLPSLPTSSDSTSRTQPNSSSSDPTPVLRAPWDTPENTITTEESSTGSDLRISDEPPKSPKKKPRGLTPENSKLNLKKPNQSPSKERGDKSLESSSPRREKAGFESPRRERRDSLSKSSSRGETPSKERRKTQDRSASKERGTSRELSKSAPNKAGQLKLGDIKEEQAAEVVDSPRTTAKREREMMFSKKREEIRDNHKDQGWVLNYDDLVIIDKIGKGVSSTVYRGTWKNSAVAIKDLHLASDKDFKDLKAELRILSRVQSPYLVHFYGATFYKRFTIVLELCSHGSLFHQLQQQLNPEINWWRILNWSYEAVRGINVLHEWDPVILHRDLKSLNLLLDSEWQIKLCDFGLSRFNNHEQDTLTKLRGTYSYTAPELYHRKNFTVKSDIFSFGIIFWEMTIRVLKGLYVRPYSEFKEIKMDYQIIYKVATKDLRPTIPEKCPEEVKRVIEQCWATDPALRPTTKELMQNLMLIIKGYKKKKKKWKKTEGSCA